MTTNEYLDAAKKRLKVDTDYKLAKWLEVNQARISAYRSGKEGMDNYTAARIANLLVINQLEVIADTNAEREKDDKKREFWRGLVKNQVKTTLIVVMLFSSLTMMHEMAEHDGIRIMRSVLLLLTIVAGWWWWSYAAKEKN